MPNLLWLEWEKAADGYRIEGPEPDFLEPEEGEEWDEDDAYLMPNSDKIVSYRPLEQHPALFMEFAHTEQTPEGVKAFADKYGLLSERREMGDEPLYEWYKEIRRMRGGIEFWDQNRKRGDLVPLVEAFNRRRRIRVEVVLKKSGDPSRASLHITPDYLLSAMWLQFAQSVSTNAHLRCCAWCPTWFVFGTGTGRRKSAHYCSDKCRKAAHRHQKEAEKS